MVRPLLTAGLALHRRCGSTGLVVAAAPGEISETVDLDRSEAAV